LQQKLLVLVDAVLVHAAASVAMGLVTQVKGVVVRVKMQIEYAHLQMPMGTPSSALAAVWLESFNLDAQRQTCLASIAVRAVGEHTAAPKALIDQV
jgi:hypothetical protein